VRSTTQNKQGNSSPQVDQRWHHRLAESQMRIDSDCHIESNQNSVPPHPKSGGQEQRANRFHDSRYNRERHGDRETQDGNRAYKPPVLAKKNVVDGSDQSGKAENKCEAESEGEA
jgi:hypothetical protein